MNPRVAHFFSNMAKLLHDGFLVNLALPDSVPDNGSSRDSVIKQVFLKPMFRSFLSD